MIGNERVPSLVGENYNIYSYNIFLVSLALYFYIISLYRSLAMSITVHDQAPHVTMPVSTFVRYEHHNNPLKLSWDRFPGPRYGISVCKKL